MCICFCPCFFFFFADDDDDEVSIERNMAAISPIPKIVTTPIKEDFNREEEDHREDEWGTKKHLYSEMTHKFTPSQRWFSQ